MGDMVANAAVAAAILLAGTAAALCIVGLVSFARVRRARLLWVSAGFASLVVQGVLYTRSTYTSRGAIAAGTEPFPPLLVLDLVLVAALYLAVLRP